MTSKIEKQRNPQTKEWRTRGTEHHEPKNQWTREDHKNEKIGTKRTRRQANRRVFTLLGSYNIHSTRKLQTQKNLHQLPLINEANEPPLLCLLYLSLRKLIVRQRGERRRGDRSKVKERSRGNIARGRREKLQSCKVTSPTY